MPNALAIAHADDVERIAHDRDATVWSLRLDDCRPAKRAALIDHHSKVMTILRRRGHRVRAAMVSRDGGEFLTLRIADHEPTRQVPRG